MTTKYYVSTEEVITTNTIGVSVERYHSQDYWFIRLYVQDAFTSDVTNLLMPNTTSSIKIEDSVGTTTFTGTISYWSSSVDYSHLDLVNCSISYVAAP